MADGRFVSRSISMNEQLAAVSLLADYLFQRCIPHLDVEGRLTGNPLLIKSSVVPLREEFTPANIAALIGELAAAHDHDGEPLVIWYEVAGIRVLEFPGFTGQQKGLRKEREAASRLPSRGDAATILTPSSDNDGPTPANVRSRSGARPAEVKGSEGKRSKGKKSASDDAANGDARAVGDDKPKSPDTWITPFVDAWRERYGGAMPIGPAVKPLKKLVDEWGTDETLRRWAIYLAATDGQFANAARFASTFGEYNAAKLTPIGGGKVLDDAQLRAATLWPWYIQAGFISAIPSKDRVELMGADAVEQKLSPSIAAFIAELKVAKPWDFRELKNDAYIIDQIAARLRAVAAKAVA